jgi:hypothetical protein
VCALIADSAQRFVKGERDVNSFTLPTGERVHFCCANTQPNTASGSHWVAACFGFSWSEPTLVSVEPNQVSLVLPKHKADMMYRSVYGMTTWVDRDSHKYCITRVPCSLTVYPSHTCGATCQPLMLVWRVIHLSGKDEFCRHVVVGPSGFTKLGLGLYSWSSVFSASSRIGVYSGVVLEHVSDVVANTYAMSLPSERRDYVMVCKGGAGWITVDAMDELDAWPRYVNDPHDLGETVVANAYFDKSGHLCTEDHVPAYELHLPHAHAKNRASELFAPYTKGDTYFRKKLKGESELE